MSSCCFLPSLESVCLSVQEKKRKIDFQKGSHGGHLGFQNDFSYFDLLIIPMLPIMFQDNWPFVSREEVKNRF